MLWQARRASARQWVLLRESLERAPPGLARVGQRWVVRDRSVVEVLERARRQFGVGGVWSHEENRQQLDLRAATVQVSPVARKPRHRLEAKSAPPFGVVPRLRSRNGLGTPLESSHG